VRTYLGEDAFKDWGWRIPFLVSIVLLAISVRIRLQLNESPAFQRMKADGKGSKAPLRESFGQWSNLKIVIIALLGLTAGQAVVWYGGQFYALFFLTQTLKVDPTAANIMVALSLAIATPFFVVFGALSDKVGRKPIILGGCLLAAVMGHLPRGLSERSLVSPKPGHAAGPLRSRCLLAPREILGSPEPARVRRSVPAMSRRSAAGRLSARGPPA
jgi:MFS family permease